MSQTLTAAQQAAEQRAKAAGFVTIAALKKQHQDYQDSRPARESGPDLPQIVKELNAQGKPKSFYDFAWELFAEYDHALYPQSDSPRRAILLKDGFTLVVSEALSILVNSGEIGLEELADFPVRVVTPRNGGEPFPCIIPKRGQGSTMEFREAGTTEQREYTGRIPRRNTVANSGNILNENFG